MNNHQNHPICYLFPGQGILKPSDIIQYLNDSRFQQKYNNVKDILREDILLSFSKGKISINDTLLHSLIIILHSIISYEQYQAENNNDNIKCLAGFSVGQFTALFVSGALSFEQLILLIGYRSKLIENSLNLKNTGMIYVIGTQESLLNELINDINLQFPNLYLGITNFNSPGNYSISGHNSCLQLLTAKLTEIDVKLWGRISISGARHCPLLGAEVELFRNFMNNSIVLSSPQIPIINNCNAKYMPKDPKELQTELINHLIMPVLWYQSIQTAISEGCSKFIEFGNGEMLSKFNFFIDRKKISTTYNYRS